MSEFAERPHETIADNDSNPVMGLEMRFNGEVDRATADEIIRKQRERMTAAREAILELPSNEEGLDMESVLACREQMGAPEVPIRFLSSEDYYLAISLAGYKPKTTEEGQMLSGLNIIILRRDPDLEARNGPGFTEANTVHEIAHSDRSNDVDIISIVKQKRRLLSGRQIDVDTVMTGGFYSQDADGRHVGMGLEEGFAELKRGRFVVDTLRRESGFAGPGSAGKFSFFEKYCMLGAEGQSVIPSGAIVATVLEEIIARDPEIESLLQKGRHNSMSQVQLEGRVDALMDGLYARLLDQDEDTGEGKKKAVGLYADMVRHFKTL